LIIQDLLTRQTVTHAWELTQIVCRIWEGNDAGLAIEKNSMDPENMYSISVRPVTALLDAC